MNEHSYPPDAWRCARAAMDLHRERDWTPELPGPSTIVWVYATAWLAREATKLFEQGHTWSEIRERPPRSRESFQALLQQLQARLDERGTNTEVVFADARRVAATILKARYRPDPGVPAIGSNAWRIAVEEAAQELGRAFGRGETVSMPASLEATEDDIRNLQKRLRQIQAGLN